MRGSALNDFCVANKIFFKFSKNQKLFLNRKRKEKKDTSYNDHHG